MLDGLESLRIEFGAVLRFAQAEKTFGDKAFVPAKFGGFQGRGRCLDRGRQLALSNLHQGLAV